MKLDVLGIVINLAIIAEHCGNVALAPGKSVTRRPEECESSRLRGRSIAVHHLLHDVSRIYTLYRMIKSFKHKGIEKFFATGSKAGIQPKHANKLTDQLTRLNAAVGAEDMNLPGWDWHPLKSDLAGHWAVSVNGSWRLTFSFEGKDAVLVDYQDYH